jgi:isopropylmalate/homocitrate/citramalate synthase
MVLGMSKEELSNIMMELDKAKDKWHTNMYWVTPYNWLTEVRKIIKAPKRVIIHDATIREGQQTPGVALTVEEQVRIAKALDELGVDRIEVIPMMSEDDEEATKRILKLGLNARTIPFVSWDKKVIDQAIGLGVDSVLIDFVGNSWQGRVFWNMSPEEITKKGLEAVSYAKAHGLYTVGLIWDDFKAPLDFVKTHLTTMVKEGHIDSIAIADTYGQSLPWATYYIANMILEWIKPATLEFHVHNDFGLATAEALAAISAGASAVHTTVAGLGERAGNVSTEEMAIALELLLGVKTGIKLEKIYDVARKVQEITKFKVGPNKPIIGENAFKFSSGWIYWMLTKAEQAGEVEGMLPFKPELIGRTREYVVSKGSGGSLILTKLEKLGIKVPKEKVEEVVREVKKEAAIMKCALTDKDLVEVAKRVLG